MVCWVLGASTKAPERLDTLSERASVQIATIEEFAGTYRVKAKADSCGEKIIPGKPRKTKWTEDKSHIYDNGDNQAGRYLPSQVAVFLHLSKYGRFEAGAGWAWPTMVAMFDLEIRRIDPRWLIWLICAKGCNAISSLWDPPQFGRP